MHAYNPSSGEAEAPGSDFQASLETLSQKSMDNGKYVYQKSSTQMFIAASFTICKMKKQPKYLLMAKQSLSINNNEVSYTLQ